MARTPKKKEDEHVETLSSGPIPEVEPKYDTTSEVVADAREKTPKREEPKAKPPRCFRVLEDKRVLVNGYRTMLRAGKEVDEVNYRIGKLIQQGVKLQEIKPEERIGAIGSSLDGYR
jgi:hypothetical protein